MLVATRLSADEIDLIRRALKASVDGPFFPDWEFETLIGASRAEVREVLAAWPRKTVSDEVFYSAVMGSLGNLCGYPHGYEEQLLEIAPTGRDAIYAVMDRVRDPMT